MQTFFLGQRTVLFLCSYSNLTVSSYLCRSELLCLDMPFLWSNFILAHPNNDLMQCLHCIVSTMLDVFRINATWSWCLIHIHPVHSSVCFHDCVWGRVAVCTHLPVQALQRIVMCIVHHCLCSHLTIRHGQILDS